MIHFFRKIRQQLFSKGKFSSYLLYALGEIALVMIGILLALQVNNWNSLRLQQNEITSKYERLLTELNSTSARVEQKAQYLDSIIVGRNKRSLELLSKKNEDSIHLIYNSLQGVTNVVTVGYDMPATNEFMEAGYISAIDNDSLKSLFLNLKRSLSFGTIVDDYAKTQLNTLIEPYVVKNINYAQMVKGQSMITVNPTRDYTVFFNDLELENILNLKIETDVTKINYLKTFNAILRETASVISSELEKSK
jgi:hypothetical protein